MVLFVTGYEIEAEEEEEGRKEEEAGGKANNTEIDKQQKLECMQMISVWSGKRL